MAESIPLLRALGGEEGCKRLAQEFYARVGADPVLRPLFPGKSLRCAIEEFAAFLIQFLGGDEEQTQFRWWLSLRESHARFRIGAVERSAWLKQMTATLEAAPLDEATRKAVRNFFEHSSAYVIGKETAGPEHGEVAERWDEQRALDSLVASIAAGRDEEAIRVAPRFASRPAVFIGVLARMAKSGRAGLTGFVVDAIAQNPSLATRRSAGRTLLHYAAGAGSLPVVTSLLRLGTDPEIRDALGHTPLYRVANECAGETGPEIVRALVKACGRERGRRCDTFDRPAHGGAARFRGDRAGIAGLRSGDRCTRSEGGHAARSRGPLPQEQCGSAADGARRCRRYEPACGAREALTTNDGKRTA